MMKKTLVALAALAAVGTSFAQSSVTISGILDASVTSFTKGDGTNDGIAYTDSQIASSQVTISGSEDLGGGMRAIFLTQTDIQTNNGGLNQNGLFRRGAYVGLTGGFGEVTLGLRGNLLIANNAAIVPVGGNTFTTNISSAIGYADFYTKNAITYVSPRLFGGLVLAGQLGMGNTLAQDDMSGSITSWSAVYTNGGLRLNAAGQNRLEGASTSSANASNTAASGNKTTTQAGVRYKVGALEGGIGYITNSMAGGAIGASGAPAATPGGVMQERTARVAGVSYQLNPATILAANFANAEGSNLTNLQARYSLSKRTSLYGIYGIASNAANTVNPVNFSATATNTGNAPAANVNNLIATADRTQTAISFGMMHSF